jgi:integrase
MFEGERTSGGATKHDTTHHRLKAVELSRLKPGMHHDGGGLWLQVRAGSRSWLFRYSRDKQAKVMGLGPLHTIGLADARVKARECRKLLLEGMDPIEAREAHRAAQRPAMTFRDAGEAFITAHEIGWKNSKHRTQWRTTLATYVYPMIGDLSVAKVDTAAVMRVLLPIWTEKPETASRVRGRIEAIIDWSTASGFRSGDNPARWQGLLENLLPKKTGAARAKREAAGRGEHHEALPYKDMPEFMVALRNQNGTAARALEYAILTAARTVEVIGARWREINVTEGVWIVPGERMKAGKEHRVPLSDRAIALLGVPGRPDDFVFEGGRPGRPLSNMAMLKLLQRMGLRTASGGVTVHGFRSTFRVWIAEETSYPGEAAEIALAHTNKDKVGAAYQRGDLLDKRRELMAAWAQFCEPVGAVEKVVPLRVRG